MRFNEHLITDNNNVIIKTFHSTVGPGKRSFREHHHTECELSLFISGSGVYSVNGRKYIFSAGDMFLFGSNEAHCITEINEEINLLNIQFEPRILWESPDNIELIQLFTSREKNFSNHFLHTDNVLHNIIKNIETEISEQKSGYRIEIKHLIFSALIHIIREYNFTKPDNHASKSSQVTENMKNAMLFIDKNLENKITLKDIADVACLTQTYFSSVFKKLNGISPWEYIMIKRVEKAIEMLKSTNMTKLEIAERCGFNSSSNFYKAFYTITGKKPNDYAKG